MIGPRGVEEVFAAPIPGGTLLPGNVPKFVTPLVIPPPMPNTGTANHYAIAVKQFSQQILPTPLPATTVWSYGANQQPRRHAQLPGLHDRGHAGPADDRDLDQRAGRRLGQLPAAPASCRPDAALGEPARRHGGARHAPHLRDHTSGPTPAPCPSSPTCTAWATSPTGRTATPRPGTCRPPATSRPATRPSVPGMTSSRPSRDSAGHPARPRSTTRTTSVPRRPGTTTTRWA